MEPDLCFDSGGDKKLSNPAGEAEGQRSHWKRVTTPAEDIGGSADMVILFHDQDPPAKPGQPGGTAESPQPGPDDDDVIRHSEFNAGPAPHSFCMPLNAFNTSIRSRLSKVSSQSPVLLAPG